MPRGREKTPNLPTEALILPGEMAALRYTAACIGMLWLTPVGVSVQVPCDTHCGGALRT